MRLAVGRAAPGGSARTDTARTEARAQPRAAASAANRRGPVRSRRTRRLVADGEGRHGAAVGSQA